MATVPQYKPSVAERPILQANLTTQASAADMGAAIGQGMQQVGAGLGQAADQLAALRDLEWENLAKDGDNRLSAIDRDLKYGTNGFMLLEGRAAVEGRAAYETALEEASRSIAAELPPGAARMFNTAADARLDASKTSAMIQSANAQKKWFVDETAARQNTFKEDAVAAWANPVEVDKQIAAGQSEIIQQGKMLGWGADTLRNQEVQYISDVRQAVAERLILEDPLKAKAYIDQYSKELTGPAQMALAEKIETPLITATGLSAASDFFSTGQRTYGASAENAGQGPTNARAFLLDRLVTPDRTEDIDGLDGAFTNNLAALFQDAPFEGLGVLSGARSVERQAGIVSQRINTYLPGSKAAWDADVASMGAEAAGAKWQGRLQAAGMTADVAMPGRSNHQKGNAVDISYNGRSLKHAPQQIVDWVHANAGKYGLNFPMAHESWHIEPVGIRGGSTAVANTGQSVPASGMPSRGDMERYLETIADPKARAVARTAIVAQMESAAKDAEANRKAIGQQAFTEMVTGNVSPFSFSPEVQSVLGLENMNSLTSYWEKMASGAKVQTDPELLYRLGQMFATDPDTFASVDKLQFVNQLSETDFKQVAEWERSVLTDTREAATKGLELNAAFGAADIHLNAAGIVTGNSEAGRNDAARVAAFQISLMQEMENFKRQNARAPDETDVQDLISKLLLPVVIKPTKVDDGLFGNHFFGVGLPRAREGFLFEAGSRPDDTVVEGNVEYEDIPQDIRSGLRVTLAQQLGRVPTDDEIVDEYEATFGL